MPNAKDRSFADEPIRILAVGPGGSGKTTFMRTLPGRKFAYIFDTAAMRSLAGSDLEYEEFLPDIGNLAIVGLKKDVRDISHRKGSQASQAYVEWETDIEEKLASGYFDQFDWLCFDSLTSFQDMAMDRVLSINNRVGKWPEQSDWTEAMNAVMRAMRAINSLPNKNIYVTAHLDPKQDGEGGKLINLINVIGKLKMRLPTLFTDIYRFYSDRDKEGKASWGLMTVGDQRNEFVRTSFGGLNPDEDVTITDWSRPEQSGFGRLLQKAGRTSTLRRSA